MKINDSFKYFISSINLLTSKHHVNFKKSPLPKSSELDKFWIHPSAKSLIRTIHSNRVMLVLISVRPMLVQINVSRFALYKCVTDLQVSIAKILICIYFFQSDLLDLKWQLKLLTLNTI